MMKEQQILQGLTLGALRSLKPDDDIIEPTQAPLPGTPGSEESGMPGGGLLGSPTGGLGGPEMGLGGPPLGGAPTGFPMELGLGGPPGMPPAGAPLTPPAPAAPPPAAPKPGGPV